MTDPIRARHVPHAELELLGDKVTKEGGELRLRSGSDYGPVTSVMHSRVAFTHIGPSFLRQTAIHQNPRAVSDLEDGTRMSYR